MARLRLLAIGTATYLRPEDALPAVPEAIRTVSDGFRKLGYTVDGVILDPTRDDAESAISDWLNDGAWGSDDQGVLYWTGHGAVTGAGLYLMAADSDIQRYARTCVRASYFAEVLGDTPSIRNLLIMLDTCHSEAGAIDARNLAAEMSKTWFPDTRAEAKYWLVASARAREEADQYVFAKAFSGALAQLSETSGTQIPRIQLASVISRTNYIFEHGQPAVHHRATLAAMLPARGEDDFFANPKYVPIQVSRVAAGVARHDELTSHWFPRARGALDALHEVSFFRGREKAIEAIAAWARAPGDTPILVITGDPGSGKSALAARLVVDTVAEDGRDQAASPKPLEVSRALYARAKTARDLLSEVGDILGDTGLKVERPLVVLDALDEAAEPAEIERSVVQELTEMGARVLIACRRTTARRLGAPQIDLDESGTYWRREDLADYCFAILTATDSVQPSPYANDPRAAGDVCEAIAQSAGKSFLVARVLAGSISRLGRALSSAEVSDIRSSMRSLEAAFNLDIARLGHDAGITIELLSALAWSRGAGLPWESVWPAVASAVNGGIAYRDADIRRVLDIAADYVVESVEHGRSVFRLYHELFAEHLRGRARPHETEASIARALVSITPTLPTGAKDWAGAHPYISTHLAEHAARGGILAELLDDASFILSADVDRLSVALSALSDGSPAPAELAAMRAVEFLRDPDRLNHVRLAALQAGADTLAASAAMLGRSDVWEPLWADRVENLARATIKRLAGQVIAIVSVELDSSVVIVAGGGEVACVEIESARVRWDLQMEARVTALAESAGVCGVSCGGVIHLLDSVTGGRLTSPESPLEVGHSVNALAVADTGDKILVAAGTYNEERNGLNGGLYFWAVEGERSELMWQKGAFGAGVVSLQFRHSNPANSPPALQLVAGGDSYGEPGDTEASIRVFQVADGTVLDSYGAGRGRIMRVVVVGKRGILIGFSSSTDRPLVRWDLESSESATANFPEYMLHFPEHIASVPGREQVVVAFYQNILVVDAENLVTLSISQLNGYVSSLAVTGTRDRSFVLIGSISGELERLRLQDLLAGHQARRATVDVLEVARATNTIICAVGEKDVSLEVRRVGDGTVLSREEAVHITSLRVSSANPQLFFAGHYGGQVSCRRMFEVEATVWELPIHTERVTAIVDLGDLIVTASTDARIQFLDAATGSPLCRPIYKRDYKDRDIVALEVVDGLVIALDYEGEIAHWRLDEVLADEGDYLHDDRNAAHMTLHRSNPKSGRLEVCPHVNGNRLIVSVGGGFIEEFDLEDWSSYTWRAHDDMVIAICATERGLLTCDVNGTIRAWSSDLDGHTLNGEIRLGRKVIGLGSLPDDRVAVATDSGVVMIAFDHRDT